MDTKEESDTLDELINLSIHLDNHLRDYAVRDHKSWPTYTVRSDLVPNFIPNFSPPVPQVAPEEEPMQIDTAHLSPEECQQHICLKLWTYRRDSGYYVNSQKTPGHLFI